MTLRWWIHGWVVFPAMNTMGSRGSPLHSSRRNHFICLFQLSGDDHRWSRQRHLGRSWKLHWIVKKFRSCFFTMDSGFYTKRGGDQFGLCPCSCWCLCSCYGIVHVHDVRWVRAWAWTCTSCLLKWLAPGDLTCFCVFVLWVSSICNLE